MKGVFFNNPTPNLTPPCQYPFLGFRNYHNLLLMCLSWKLPEGRYMTCPSLPQCLTYHSAWHTLSRLSEKFCSGKDGWIPFTMTVSLVKVIPRKNTNTIIKLISAGDLKCPLGYSLKFHFTRVRGFPRIWSEGGFSGHFIRLHMTCQASKCDGTACRSELRRQLTVVSAFALWLEQVLNLLRALVLICSTTVPSYQLPRQQTYIPDWPNVPCYCLQETIPNKLPLPWKSIILLITITDDTRF